MTGKLHPIPFELLRKLLRADFETGLLYWLPRPREMFKRKQDWRAWNTRHAHKEALTALNTDGYKHGTILGRRYDAHRVLWCLATGCWPVHGTDHINGIQTDNRPDNLRDVPQSTNMKNKKRNKRNSSGCTGVTKTTSDKWVSYIGSKERLGTFDTFEEAVAVRKAAERKHNYHPNHGRVM